MQRHQCHDCHEAHYNPTSLYCEPCNRLRWLYDGLLAAVVAVAAVVLTGGAAALWAVMR